MQYSGPNEKSVWSSIDSLIRQFVCRGKIFDCISRWFVLKLGLNIVRRIIGGLNDSLLNPFEGRR